MKTGPVIPDPVWPLVDNHLAFIATHRGTVHREHQMLAVTGYADFLSFWVPLTPVVPLLPSAVHVRLYPGSGTSWPGRLAEAGFAPTGTLRYLTARVDAETPGIQGLDIARVRTEAEAAEFAGVQRDGFLDAADDGADRAWWSRTFVAAARRNHAAPGQAFYLARCDGVPAAVTLCVHTPGLCGVYAVATRPEFRRRGLATALLEGVRRDAAGRGTGQLTLQVAAGSAAERLYRRLGFTPAFDSPCYARPARRSASAIAPSD